MKGYIPFQTLSVKHDDQLHGLTCEVFVIIAPMLDCDRDRLHTHVLDAGDVRVCRETALCFLVTDGRIDLNGIIGIDYG